MQRAEREWSSDEFDQLELGETEDGRFALFDEDGTVVLVFRDESPG